MLSKLVKREGGQALLLVLILLGVGALMLVPLLDFMGTGLNAVQIHETKTYELYAADAGVEDAIWKIQNDGEGLVDTTRQEDYNVTLYGLPLYLVTEDDDGNPLDPPFKSDYGTYNIANVNGKSIEVTIQYLDGTAYLVESTATSADGSGTMVTAYIASLWRDYSGITQHVITSQDGYHIHKDVEVEPPDPYPDDLNGARADYPDPWPSPEGLAAWYSRDVEDVDLYSFDTVDIQDVPPLPPPPELIRDLDTLLREGTLSIVNKGTAGLTLKLNGTIYITGDTLIGTTNKDFTLDLNKQTIFVENAFTKEKDGKEALEIGGKCTLTGSGCIIAVGDIKFQPKMQASEDDYILVLSVIGLTEMYPSGDFFGTLAGSVHVDVKSGETPHIEWNPPPDDLNFPGGGGGPGMVWGILTWEISKVSS